MVAPKNTALVVAKMRNLEGIDMNKEPADEVGNRTGTSVKSPDLYLSPDQIRRFDDTRTDE